jgi:adenine-specific DNA-methyltransferase
MNKLDLQTPDFVAANAARLAELFPNCVTESRHPQTGEIKRAIDFDLLRQELAYDLIEGPQERYRLDWPGKREALALANAPIRKTLRPCKDESVDFDTTHNLYIEGDNLDALKLLQETYLGKVKMIYIDPPYNTGNDFIYDDNFSISGEDHDLLSGTRDAEGNAMFQEEKWKQNSSSNGRFHSEWLSMIYPRLKLARNLLREDGVIFMSIDDNEIENLSKIASEVFGSENFLFRVTLLCNPKGRSHDKYVANCHEYVLAYARNPLPKECLNIPKSIEEIANDYPLRDSRGAYRELELRNTHREFGKHNRPNLYYPFYVNTKTGGVSLNATEDESVEVIPDWEDGFQGCWTWGKEKAQAELRDLVGKEVKGGWKVYRKGYAGKDGEEATKKVKSIWTDRLLQTEKGQGAFNELFDTKEKIFQSPKSVSLISLLSQMATREDDIVLDFFSGSSSAAHAVMQLNASDGGKRRHIMVQLPEPCDEKSEAFKAGYKTIAEIGKERIRRAGKKIRTELEEKLAKELKGSEEHSSIKSRLDSLDTGFRVLKIDSSNMADVYYQPDELKQDALALQVDNLKPGRKPEDLLFQVLLDWGVDLALPITEEKILKHRVFFVAENALVACFDTGLDEAFVKELAKRQPLRAVFRDSGYATDSVKINFEQIFRALSPHTELKTL